MSTVCPKVRKVKKRAGMIKCIKSDATELNSYKGKSEGRESWGSRQGPDPDRCSNFVKVLDCGPMFPNTLPMSDSS